MASESESEKDRRITALEAEVSEEGRFFVRSPGA